MREGEIAVLARVLDVERPGEVGPHVVRRAGLQGPAIAHHALDGERADRAGEPLARRLLTLDDRHGRHLAGGAGVDRVQREHGLPHGVGLVRVRGVALLPEELRRPQEHPRPQLPAHHVGPLVEQHGQLPVRADPFGHELADDRLGGGPDDQRLLQLLAPGVGDHGQLRREALNVFCLTLQVALRDEQREVRVLVTGLLDAPVQIGLDQLPKPVSVRADDHRALGRAAVHELRLEDQFVVPGGEVFALGRHSAFVSSHIHEVRPVTWGARTGSEPPMYRMWLRGRLFCRNDGI